MKKLKKITDSIRKFCKKAKKKIMKKILIVSTCLVCIFAPVYSSYQEVNALVGVDDALVVSGVLSVLALCGVGVADAVGPEKLTETCYKFVDGFTNFGNQLVGNVKNNFETLMNGIVYGGNVVLSAFNGLGNELGHCVYDMFHTSVGNSYVGDLELTEGVSDFISFQDTNFYLSNGNPLNNPNFNKFFYGASGICAVGSDGIYICSYEGESLKNSYLANHISLGSFLTAKSIEYSKLSVRPINNLYFYRYDSNANILGSSMKLYLDNIDFVSFFGSYFTVSYGSSHDMLFRGNQWINAIDLTLELDPPWITNRGTNSDMKLLDDSYINYGDIEDVALPRYVAPDATKTIDNVIDYPGTWAIPNEYIPNLERPVPVPLPLPLPGLGTIDGTYTGDITGDTTIEDDYDGDIDNPDYIPPTVGDFLGEYDVPGKLNWKEYFPFCIPFDLIKFLGVLASNPQAPSFQWNYDLAGSKGTLKIDLSKFDTVAVVCRTLFDLLFIVGLTFVTRNIIKG